MTTTKTNLFLTAQCTFHESLHAKYCRRHSMLFTRSI